MLSIYFCGSEKCAPGHFFGPAIRPHYLLHVVLQGKGIFKNKGNTYSLNAGDAFLISPMESTYYEADSADPWTYAWIGFDDKEEDHILNQTCFQNSCIFTGPRDEAFRSLLCRRAKNMLNTFHYSEYSSLELLGQFLVILGMMQGTPESRPEEISRQYLKRALDYMHNNYSYRIKISDIASAVGIDRTYLYRIFMEKEQISPKQYLLRLRLRMAANMLRSPQFTITEIAYSCGFQDAAAFCNQFRKAVGITPSRFRANMITETKAEL